MLTINQKSSYPVVLIAITVFLLSACGGNSKKDEVIKAMEENLLKSNVSINISTTTMMKALQEKTTDWSTKERAEIWYAKAQNIAKTTQGIYDFITAAKRDLGDDKLSATTLRQKLFDYKKEILNVDSNIQIAMPEIFKFVDSFSTSSFLKSSSTLSIIQNDIKVTENKIIAFCHTKVGSSWDGFFSYSAIVGQSSNCVNPGEEITINAGVGAYSKSALPFININGKNILVGEEGFASYKIKSPKTPGKYTIPVLIDFTNPDTGKKETKKVYVEYTVAAPCN